MKNQTLIANVAIITILITTCYKPVSADVKIVHTFASRHSGEIRDETRYFKNAAVRREVERYNEHNPGFGLIIGDQSLYFHGGYYKNSYSNTSTYATFGREWRYKWVSAGLEAGVVTGYDKPILGVLPFVSAGPEQFNVRSFLVPEDSGLFFGFQARLQLW